MARNLDIERGEKGRQAVEARPGDDIE